MKNSSKDGHSSDEENGASNYTTPTKSSTLPNGIHGMYIRSKSPKYAKYAKYIWFLISTEVVWFLFRLQQTSTYCFDSYPPFVP